MVRTFSQIAPTSWFFASGRRGWTVVRGDAVAMQGLRCTLRARQLCGLRSLGLGWQGVQGAAGGRTRSSVRSFQSTAGRPCPWITPNDRDASVGAAGIAAGYVVWFSWRATLGPQLGRLGWLPMRFGCVCTRGARWSTAKIWSSLTALGLPWPR